MEWVRDMVIIIWRVVVFASADLGVNWINRKSFDSILMLKDTPKQAIARYTYWIRRLRPVGSPGKGT